MSGERLLREALDFLGVLAPQLAVDRQELLQRVAVGFDLRTGLENGRHDAIEKPVVELDPAALERLRERQMVELRARGVARLIAGVGEHRRVDVLIEAQREERHLDGGIGDAAPLRSSRRRPGSPGYVRSPTCTPDSTSAGVAR